MRCLSKIQKFAIGALLALSLTGPLPAKAQSDDVWNVLRGFNIVADSLLQLDEHYILALFHNMETDVFALVLFNVDCEGNACRVNRGAAYSLYSDGVNFFTHVDPRDEGLGIGGAPAAFTEKHPPRDGTQI